MGSHSSLFDHLFTTGKSIEQTILRRHEKYIISPSVCFISHYFSAHLWYQGTLEQ